VFTYFKKRYCDNNNISYDRFWRSRESLKCGDLILTDDNFVIPVSSANGIKVIFPESVYARDSIYFFLADSMDFKENVRITFKKWMNVEELISVAFKNTLSIRKTVSLVFGNVNKAHFITLRDEIYRSERIMGFLMTSIQELFDNSGVNLSDSVKRMNANAELLQSYVAKLINTEDGKPEDVMKVIAMSHKLNHEMISFGLGENLNPSTQYFLPPNE
jgi:hypothetical protein